MKYWARENKVVYAIQTFQSARKVTIAMDLLCSVRFSACASALQRLVLEEIPRTRHLNVGHMHFLKKNRISKFSHRMVSQETSRVRMPCYSATSRLSWDDKKKPSAWTLFEPALGRIEKPVKHSLSRQAAYFRWLHTRLLDAPFSHP